MIFLLCNDPHSDFTNRFFRRATKTTPLKIGTPPKASLKPRPKAPFVFAGIAAYVLAAYGAYVYFSIKNIPEHTPQKEEQIDKSHVYENIARKYDNEIWASEFFMGMSLLRRSLGKRAKVSIPLLPLCDELTKIM